MSFPADNAMKNNIIIEVNNDAIALNSIKYFFKDLLPKFSFES